jgi:hypothetical protein
MMFNSLGNLVLNVNVGILFIDFEKGTSLHISGTSQVIFDHLRSLDDSPIYVKIAIKSIIQIEGYSPLRFQLIDYSHYNPKISGNTPVICSIADKLKEQN